MRRLLTTIFAMLAVICAGAQADSLRYARMDSLLREYCVSMERFATEDKNSECDFLVGSCRDSLTRQHTATYLYNYYINSRLMGEEAVAIHIYDNWFASGKVKMANDLDQFNAGIYADFNRNSLIGMDAPVITLEDPEGNKVTLPSKGRTSLLYFYETDCSKCKATSIMLPYALDEAKFGIDAYIIYTGSNAEAWKSFRDKFSCSNPLVRITHLWDPDMDSDHIRLYAVMSTPQMFMIEPQGSIIGRKLEVESVLQLLPVAQEIQMLYDRFNKK